MKRHLASQGVYGGGKRPFGWDVVDGKLVPNGDEQAALKLMASMHRKGKTYREIGSKFGKDPKTIQRILTRGTAKAQRRSRTAPRPAPAAR